MEPTGKGGRGAQVRAFVRFGALVPSEQGDVFGELSKQFYE